MELICSCFIPLFINISNSFNICKIWNVAIFINKLVIIQHIKWVFAEMHYACFAYFISVFFISSILFVLLTSAYHSFIKCFIPFYAHHLSSLFSNSFNCSANFLHSSATYSSVRITSSIGYLLSTIFRS